MRAARPAGAPAKTAPTLVDPGRHKQRASLAVIGFVVLGLTLGALGHVAVHAKRLEVALALGDAASHSATRNAFTASWTSSDVISRSRSEC